MKTVIAVMSLMLIGCAPSGKMLKQKYDEGVKAGEGRCASRVEVLNREIAARNERLRRFNQLDKDGGLIIKKSGPAWNGDTDKGEVTGKESWQK